MKSEILEGWGRFRKGKANVHHPVLLEDLKPFLSEKQDAKVLAIGDCKSYGDACLNTHNNAFKFGNLDHVTEFDRDRGFITVEAGVSIKSLICMSVTENFAIENAAANSL